jgi:hypothetical protein
MDRDEALRNHLIALLDGGQAHLRYDDVVADWPRELRGVRPEGAAHSPWQVLEHLRICQWDILDFSCNAEYEALDWPADYWPAEEEPPTPDAWEKSINSFRGDMAQMKTLVEDRKRDLYEPFRWGDGQTLLREAMLVADHNAYHLGELMALKKRLVK